MTLPSIKTIKNIKPSKTVVLVATALLVVLAITAAGIVQKVQTERTEAVQAALEEQRQKDAAEEVKRLKEQVRTLQNANQFQTAKAESVCDWVRSTQARYRYTVPPLCVKR